MSDQHELSAKISADTGDFKEQISILNREIRVLESEFKASSAGLGDWTKDATGLEQRAASLTKEIEKQKQVVEAQTRILQQIIEKEGEHSRAAQEQQIKVNKATETLGKMTSKLGDTEDALDKTSKKTLDLSGAVSGLQEGLKVGVAAVAGLVAAVAGAGAAIGKMVLNATDAAGELVDLSLVTGISTERLQELSYVGDQVGTDLETMTGSLSKLTRNMDTAKEQQEAFNEALASGKMEDEINVPIEMAASFNQLGVAFTDANGRLRDSEAVFADVIDALGGVENETERDALAMQIFGKSAMELNPLIKAGADEIARLSEEARDMGAVMSEEDVAGLESFGDSLAGLQAGLKGTLGTLATAFLPGFQGIVGTLQGYMGQFAGIVGSSNGDMVKIAEGMGGLVGQIVTDLASKGPELLQAGLGIVQGILDAIISALPTLIPAAIGMLTSLVTFIIENLPMLIQAAFQIIVMLAQGIAQALPQLIPAVMEIIPKVVTTLIENLPLLVSAAIEIIVALVNGLVAALPQLIAYAPQIITALVEALITALPQLVEAAWELITTLVGGIVDNLPEIGKAALQIIETLYVGVLDLTWKLGEVGWNIVTGIWEGIQAKYEWFKGLVTGFFTGIIDAVKKKLGITSPSKVFGEIGENMALGLGMGFEGAFGAISRDIGRAVGGLAPAISMSGAPGVYAANRMQTVERTVHIEINGVNILSELDMRRWAYMIAEEIQREGG